MGESAVEVIFVPWPYDAVARGVALLDEKVPGWRERIDTGRLDMADCEDCVLGALYGAYDEGLDKLDLWGTDDYSEKDSDLHGFTIRGPNPRGDTLEQAWREAIVGGSK